MIKGVKLWGIFEMFLQAKYKDCDNNDEIQKIINYVWCNYLNNFKHFK